MGQGWVCARGGRHAFSRLLYAPRPAEEGGGRGRGVNRARKSRGGKGKRGLFANENGVQPYPGGERISLLSAGFFASVVSRFSSGMGFLQRRRPPTPVFSGDSFKSPRTEKGRGQEEYFFSSNFDLEFREVRSDATASRERKGVRFSSVRSGRFPHP